LGSVSGLEGPGKFDSTWIRYSDRTERGESLYCCTIPAYFSR